MTDEELRSYEYKVREAKRIKDTIKAIDDFVEKMKITGKCDEIKFTYHGKCETGGFGFEVGEYYDMGFGVTPESLHISKQEFEELFTRPIINYILSIKEQKLKEFEELK
jgi:hypothetical protein